MSTLKKNNDYITRTGRAIISDKVKDHSNDPFFVKKVEEAKIAVSKLVFPDDLKK